MRLLALVLAVLSSLAVAGCDKASVQECDKGCRNYFTLHYWEEAEAEIAAAPEAERAALRADKERDYHERLKANLELCIQKCTSGAESGRATCWANAKSTEDAKKCE